MSECYFCFEKIQETQDFLEAPVCSCKGTINLHKKCFEKILDYGFEFCSICGDRYKNIDPPLVWEKVSDQSSKPFLLAEVVIRKNGKKSIYKIDKLGRIQGECKVYYIGSSVTERMEIPSLFTKSYYVNGKLEGKYIEYYKNSSSILMESYFRNGVPNGLCRFYYQSSVEASEPKVSSDDTFGSLCEECFYKDGYMEGLAQTFYEKDLTTSDGTFNFKASELLIKERKHYKAGKLDGKAQEFDKLGRVILEGFYEADVKKGVWKSYTYY
jgi:antitoxin component YwqK of YwqJK toxin-antitoxin module